MGPFLKLYKLNYDGIRGCTLQWIKKFLIRQEQRVLIEWMSSFFANVNSGVQWSPGGGYIFADDCLIYKTNQPTTQSNKEDLNAFGKWKKWLAGGITPAETYHHPYLKKRYPAKASYQLHSHTLEETCHGASVSFQIRLRQLEQLVFWESTEIAQMKYMIWHRQTTTQE